MTAIHSFPFSADSKAQVLVLGSMPGAESLRQQQYYAHPRNLFWTLMEEFFGIDRRHPYDTRLAELRQRGIALWDVAYSCQREGSLDANITDVAANDFESLFRVAPHIHTLFFNGKKAATLFEKQVAPDLRQPVQRIVLPSTSPANAAISLTKKRAEWERVRTALVYRRSESRPHREGISDRQNTSTQ